MATEKIFFSYSRADAAFVLKLAKDLRDAGAELWLDQLDIKPGSRWDSSIQAALNTARSLIVVLSDTSVKSDNVMDEVSFALEKGKTVIPVLICECTPPFRLSRLQRIDFTGDYQTGLNQLLETLDQTTGSYDAPQEGPSSLPGDKENPATGQKKNLSKSEAEKKDKELERLLWEKAKKQDTLNAYNHYINEYPAGIYKADALERIKNLKESGVQEEVSAAVKPAAARSKTNETKSKWKKYLFLTGGAVIIKFLVGGILIIALIVWGVMQLGKNPGSATTDSDKKLQDSIHAANVKAEEDSIADAKKKAEAVMKASIELGKPFQGGIIFYIDKTTGEHGLIAATDDQSSGIKWGDGKTTGATFAAIGSGQDNTDKILYGEGRGNAAQKCDDLKIEVYNDWYLPSKDELNLLWQSKTYFEAGSFANEDYWSSTEQSKGNANVQNFGTGHQIRDRGKKALCHVRAIRSF
jgi:hypothetical protein